ncbi:unnamed protein product [Didymodactylos carnosus]|uniref:EGF-like domain-containing protein n=1 Tax=Didymodactylos carnosus TaxID=1234261 RepID=A0A8S2HN10_9BILA|nr:unnamed protein product [Didymodactylos carnosus]CAF3668423.1 unnamed protein product [Didymodactylos carnosus]
MKSIIARVTTVGLVCRVIYKLTCNCAQNAPCIQLDRKKCICPIGRAGSTCDAIYDPCTLSSCQNNGTCMPVDDRSLKYVCVCSERYYGDICQYKNAHVTILSNNSTTIAIAAIVHFLNIHPRTGFMIHENSYLYKKFKLTSDNSLELILEKQMYLSNFIYIQMFRTSDRYYGIYYLVALLKQNQIKSIKPRLIQENRCPHVNELIKNQSVRDLSQLKRVKYYYDICVMNKQLRCFHDEIYQCFCDKRSQLDCLIFDHSVNNCPAKLNYCQNNALCKQTNRQGQWDFICICEKCYSRTLCQFTALQYSVSLEALIGS